MKVCFVGTGSIGKRHIKNWVELCKKKGCKIEIHLLRNKVGKLDADIEALVFRQAEMPEELDEWYDAIFICNPTFKHYDTILKLKNHSKYFFVEKPVFADCNIEVDELQLPKHNIYYVACPLRYTKVLSEAGKILKNESVLSVRAISSSYLPKWRENTDYRNTYSAHKNQGGGVRIDLIHEWDYIIHLFGFPDESSIMYGKYSNLEIDSEDLAIYIAKYSDKLVELHLDYFGRRNQRLLEVRTDKAEYIFDISGNRVLKNGSVLIKFDEEKNDMYMKEMEFFWSVMFLGQESENTLEEAVRVLKIAKGEM